MSTTPTAAAMPALPTLADRLDAIAWDANRQDVADVATELRQYARLQALAGEAARMEREAAQAKPVKRMGRCENHKQAGGCPLHNLHCGWPKCDEYPAALAPPVSAAPAGDGMERAYWLGWRNSAAWADRKDLWADSGSPAYLRERDDDLSTLRASLAAPSPQQSGEACPERKRPGGCMHRLSLSCSYPACCPAPTQPAAGEGIPEVAAWVAAKQEHRRLVGVYNERLAYARQHELGRVSCDHEYQAMCAAQRAMNDLVEPMFAALTAAGKGE